MSGRLCVLRDNEAADAVDQVPLVFATGDKVMARFEMGEIASMAELQPNGDSLFELGMIYSTGRDVGADLVAAHKWFNLAALKGKSEAIYYRQQVSEEMTPAAVAEAQRAAREWLVTH